MEDEYSGSVQKSGAQTSNHNISITHVEHSLMNFPGFVENYQVIITVSNLKLVATKSAQQENKHASQLKF